MYARGRRCILCAIDIEWNSLSSRPPSIHTHHDAYTHCTGYKVYKALRGVDPRLQLSLRTNMADELVQQVLALLAQPTFVGSRSCTEDAANATLTASGDMPSATQGAPATGLPTVLAPLLALIMWLPALPDWLKLLVVGGVVEACRRTLFVLYRRAASAFVITVTLDDDSECYSESGIHLDPCNRY